MVLARCEGGRGARNERWKRVRVVVGREENRGVGGRYMFLGAWDTHLHLAQSKRSQVITLVAHRR